MAINDNFTIDELCTQIRLCFPYEEMYDFNPKQFISQMEESEDGTHYTLRLRGKKLIIDKKTGSVWEAEKH